MTSHDNPTNRGRLWRGGVDWVKEKAEIILYMCLSTSYLAPQVQFVLWGFFYLLAVYFLYCRIILYLKSVWCVWLSVVLFENEYVRDKNELTTAR